MIKLELHILKAHY